jgi:hypothetical protein
MKDIQKRIDEMVSKILKEEIEKKSEEMSEKLHGGQHKLDVAKPKGQLTRADFKKLGSKKKETKEEIYSSPDSELGDYEDDEDFLDDEKYYGGETPQIGPKHKGTRFASFNDEDWFDEHDYPYTGDFDFDYDEEEFDEFEPFNQKYGDKVKWFSPDKSGESMFKKYKEKFGPLKIRHSRDLGEAETEEGNAFSGALADAKKQGKDSFEVDGKKYQVKESEEKWIQKTDMKKGALRKKLGIPEGEKIPKSKLNSLKKDLMSKSKGDKKLSASDAKLLKQVNLALTLGDIKENKESLRLTESELIDLIESIVKEQKSEKMEEPKDNIKIKTPIGLTSVEKANKKTGEISDAQIKDTAKKIADYMKDGSKEKFTTDPKHFPKGNGELAKMDKKTYKPSSAVEEYIDNFTAAGMENIVFDEIHPDEEWIDKNMEGSSITGNNPEWANAVETGVNKKRNKIRKDNLLGAVKQMAYNKAPQPTEETENPTTGQKFNMNFGKGAGVKANKILNQLESVEDKSKTRINEDMEKMRNLITYNRKTQ